MKIEDFEDLSEDDDIVLQIEQLKMGLTSRATGGSFDQDEYKRLRKLVLGIPSIKEQIPRFIKFCRTVDEFWEWIKAQASTYAERRVLIAQALNPLLEIVEYETGEGALEFKKNYEEKAIIGTGGFGQVYLFEHRLLKIPFAVKVFAPAFYKGGEKELERFFQEARMLFSLNHPSIIKVHDAGLFGKRPFIRMEYFEGRNINELLREFGVLDPQKSLILMKNIVDGMIHAHEDVGIIHRDLKPSNIMAAHPEKFRIIDFGMSIFVENELHSRLTKTGESTVSGYYTAPELIENPKLVDKKSDIYSLGAIWYTLLTGRPPAGSDIIAKLSEIDGITADYIHCIQMCLADLDKRFTNCNDLMEKLEVL